MNNIFEILKQVTDFEALPTKVLGATVAEDIIFTRKAMDWLINEQTLITSGGQTKEEADNAKRLQKTNFPLNENTQSVFTGGEPCLLRLYMRSTADKSKQYCMAFDNQITDFDNVYQLGKINIVIDRKNLFYFMGIIVDYVENENEEGFVFLDTDDQKVGDYYEMLADKQALANYNENVDNDGITPDAETLEQTPSILYQDELYDIKEVATEDEILAENNLEQEPQNVEPAEDSPAQNNSQQNTATNEPDQMQNVETSPLEDSMELSGSSTIPQEEADTSADNVEEHSKLPQKADAHEEQATLPPDNTSVVQKRAITGIHFQD